MRQVQRAIDVHNKIVKLLLFIGLLMVFNSASAQIDDFEFQRSFVKIFKYPDSLRNRCIPTYTNILIEVSAKGAVQNISVSDSAPKDFKNSFNKIRKSIDLRLLDSIITSKKLNNKIIIPVFYLFTPENCNNAVASPGELADNYYVFNGQKLEGSSFCLKPIIIVMYKTLH